MLWTSDGRQNNVVYLLGRVFYKKIFVEFWISILLKRSCKPLYLVTVSFKSFSAVAADDDDDVTFGVKLTTIDSLDRGATVT